MNKIQINGINTKYNKHNNYNNILFYNSYQCGKVCKTSIISY